MNSKPPGRWVSVIVKPLRGGVLDLLKNQQANWWCPDHDVYEYYAQLSESPPGEIEVISIDPVVTSTHEYLGREHVKHIAVNPQTDVPLQLALAYTLYSENLYDKNFLANYCVGFEQFLPNLLGEKTVSRKMPHGLKN